MIILAIYGSEYEKKLFNNWPNYLEDCENVQQLCKLRFPHTLCEEFLSLNFEDNVKILDVACGPGNVAHILKGHGYTNIDGLDQAQTMLDAAQKKHLYRHIYCCDITPEGRSPIPDESYDVLLCSAGFFPGAIDPRAFNELIRHVKIGGFLAWNIDRFYTDCDVHDKKVAELLEEGIWCKVQPEKKVIAVFDDEFAYIYVMKRLK